MAKIAETIFVVKASKLVTDDDTTTGVLPIEVIEQLTEIIKELSDGAMVEIDIKSTGE